MSDGFDPGVARYSNPRPEVKEKNPIKKRPRCPDCKSALIGLYSIQMSNRKNGKKYKMKDHRRAWFCKKCPKAWRDNEVVYEKVVYVKKER